MTLRTETPTARINVSCCPTCERPWQAMPLPQKLLDALARDLPVVYFAESREVELRKEGDRLIGRCPFHGGDALLVIEEEGTRWSCTGGCPQGGTSVEWFMKVHGSDRRTTVERMLRSVSTFQREQWERRRRRLSV